jgi:hypothetical protein
MTHRHHDATVRQHQAHDPHQSLDRALPAACRRQLPYPQGLGDFAPAVVVTMASCAVPQPAAISTRSNRARTVTASPSRRGQRTFQFGPSGLTRQRRPIADGITSSRHLTTTAGSTRASGANRVPAHRQRAHPVPRILYRPATQPEKRRGNYLEYVPSRVPPIYSHPPKDPKINGRRDGRSDPTRCGRPGRAGLSNENGLSWVTEAVGGLCAIGGRTAS